MAEARELKNNWIREGTRSYHTNGRIIRHLDKSGNILRTMRRCENGRVEAEGGVVDTSAQCKNASCSTAGGAPARCFAHGGRPAGERIKAAQRELTAEREERINRYIAGMPAEVAKKFLAYNRDRNRAKLESETEIAYGYLFTIMNAADFDPLNVVSEERVRTWLLTIATLEEKANKIATSEQYVASPEALRKIMASFTNLVRTCIEDAHKDITNDTSVIGNEPIVQQVALVAVERTLAEVWKRFLRGMDKRGQGDDIRSDALTLAAPADDVIEGEFSVS